MGNMEREEKEKAAVLLSNDVDDKKEKDGEKEEERETWAGGLDFTMSALSFAVGMGNMWRFPYLCYSSGGGAFLIPYVIMVCIAGLPLVFLEFTFGQYGRLGVVSIWKVCPLFQGAGWGMFFVSVSAMIYYNMLNGWCIYYIANSFAKDVPWRDCGNSWNSDRCGDVSVLAAQSNCTQYNGTFYNETCYTVESAGEELFSKITNVVNLTDSDKLISPSDEYFHHRVLGITDSITDFGHFSWQLMLCLLFVWTVVFLCLLKGIKASGKVTYVTAVFPYIILVILFVRGITLEGSTAGIIYYLKPDFKKLASFKVWVDAAIQVFFSLSVSWGGLVTLASYNHFKNNCLVDAIVVTVGDCLTSIFGGVVVFSFIGYMAEILKRPIEDVATQGAGLAFIVYPQAVTTLPLSPLWAILFMLMMLNVGIGTQFALVQTVHATLIDVLGYIFNTAKRRALLLFGICITSFVLGLFICTGAGMYVLQLMDTYAATYGLLYIGCLLCIALTWVYGMPNFAHNIEQMTGKRPSIFFVVCWRFIVPGLLTLLLIFTLVDFKRTKYADYTLPIWADVIGWTITVIEFACFPVVAFYHVYHAQGDTLMEKIREAASPSADWARSDTGEPLCNAEGIAMTPLKEHNHNVKV